MRYSEGEAMSKKLCKYCKWWEASGTGIPDEGGWCKYAPLPKRYTGTGWMFGKHDATYCPCWKEKP